MSTISINSKELLKALNFAGKAIPNTAITPIFECVLIHAHENGLIEVTGSDSTTVIQTHIVIDPREVDLGGNASIKIAAPYDLLSRTLSTLPSAPVLITYTNDGEKFPLQIDYENEEGRNAIFEMMCEDPHTYFIIPSVNNGPSIKIPGQQLQRGIDQVINFVSEDNMKPSITGVNIEIKDGVISFFATNAMTIGIYEREFESEDLDVLIPGKFAKLISEFIGESEAEIKLEFSDRYIKAYSDSWRAYSTRIEEKFPNCRAVIPSSFGKEAVVNAEVLKNALKRAAVYAEPTKTTAKMVFNEKNLFISSDFQEKGQKCDQDIAIESEMDSFSIGFNMKTLGKLMQTVSGDFKMSFVDYNKAVLINPDVAEGETIDYIIMPVITLT